MYNNMFLPAEYPDNWAKQDGDFLLDLLDQQSSEFLAIESLFHQTLTRRIVRIERIQNRPLWCKYNDCSRRMMKTNEGKLGQKMLFHGTRTTNPEKIYKGSASFDMTFSQQGMWGKGNYFAVNASYSDTYAHRESPYEQMLLAYVLTGFSYTSHANSLLTRPPLRSGTVGDNTVQHQYDSINGCTLGSTVYITYENDKAYPAYLITYT